MDILYSEADENENYLTFTSGSTIKIVIIS